MSSLKPFCLFLLLASLGRAGGSESSSPSMFKGSESSGEFSTSLGVLNLGQSQSLENTTFDTKNSLSLESFQDPSEPSTIGSMLSGDRYAEAGSGVRTAPYEPRDRVQEESSQPDSSKPSRKTKRSQDPFSVQKLLSKYSLEEVDLLNQYYLSFALLVRKGLKKYIFRRLSPSRIRSTFAKRYSERFGGSKAKALLRLREFEKRLSLKHSAARKLFATQLRLLTSTLGSAESLTHLSERWRHQPTYVSEPVLVVNKSSYHKLRNLCRKNAKKISVLLVSASPESIPKKYRKPDLSESYRNLPSLGKTIQSFQESVRSGETRCTWNSLGKGKRTKKKSFKSRLTCLFKSKKLSFAHIHYHDVSNVAIFKHLMLSLVRHRPDPHAQSPPLPLIIVPVLMGIPQVDGQGSILGLESIIEVSAKRKFGRSHSARRKKRSRKSKSMLGK